MLVLGTFCTLFATSEVIRQIVVTTTVVSVYAVVVIQAVFTVAIFPAKIPTLSATILLLSCFRLKFFLAYWTLFHLGYLTVIFLIFSKLVISAYLLFLYLLFSNPRSCQYSQFTTPPSVKPNPLNIISSKLMLFSIFLPTFRIKTATIL